MAAPAAAASAAAAAAAAAADDAPSSPVLGPSDYADLPALTSTPNVADLALTQGDDGGPDKAAGAAGESEEGNMVDVLRRVWIAEKAVPELLKYEDAIVADVKAALDDRQRELTHFKSDPRMQFLCTVLQMEADRIHFMLVSYHRIRLKKIERFAAHLVFSGEGERRCSNHEMTFLNGYIDLLNSHLHTSFLSQLPSRMQKWIDPANPHKEPGVIESPDRDNTFVIFKVKESIEQYMVSEHEAESFQTGDIMVGNWKMYYNLFTEGLIELM